MTGRILAALLAILPVAALAQGGGPSMPQPSVLVATETPRQGSLPRTLTAYGTVQAAPGGGSETLSLLRAGQVKEVFVTPGEAVRRGQKLFAVSAAPTALAAYQQAVAALNLAQGQRARVAQMLSQHLATREQLAQAEKAVADAKANIDALDRAGGGSAEQTLTAPFDGIVASLLVTPGTRIAPQAPLATLARANRLVAAVGFEPARRGLVAPGQPARIEPLDGGGAVPGSVLSVGAMLDPQSRLVPVLVDPPQPASPNGSGQGDPGADPQGESPEEVGVGLMPGGPVRVVVQVGELHGWLVPRDAVLTDAKGTCLFQVDGGKAARVGVKILGTSGGTTLVAGRLDPRRPLVTSGNYQLHDGSAVRGDTASAGGGATRP